MTSTAFGDRLAQVCEEKDSSVCVGLDPRWGQLPDAIKAGIDESDLEQVAKATQCYCQEVIDAVAESAPVIKPQAAFFEQLGPHGCVALANVIRHTRKAGLLLLLDGKRGDIGSTAEGYASAYLGQSSPWGCDALTVNPYLGQDTLEPFHQSALKNDAGIFVLVKTSNPGSGFLQDVECENGTIATRVANHVQSLSTQTTGDSGFGPVGAVVGATYPEQLAEMRELMANAWILIPGFGAQGGTIDDVRPGFKSAPCLNNPQVSRSTGAIVNSSRGIIFAYQKPEYSALSWQEAVAKAAVDMRDQLRTV